MNGKVISVIGGEEELSSCGSFSSSSFPWMIIAEMYLFTLSRFEDDCGILMKDAGILR